MYCISIKRSVYCQYGQYGLTFRALVLHQSFLRLVFSRTKGQRSKRQTILSVLAVHRPFYISICISTLPTQHTTFTVSVIDMHGSIMAGCVIMCVSIQVQEHACTFSNNFHRNSLHSSACLTYFGSIENSRCI